MELSLTVKVMNGEEEPVNVSSDTKVGELKQIISRQFHEPCHKQKLFIDNGIRINLDDDSRSLSSYGLHSGSVVMLLITNPGPFQVFVRNEKGQTKTYDVDANQTVDHLQTKVCSIERVHKDQQILIYNGRQLEAGKTLQDCGIRSGSTIQMTLRLRGG